MKTAFALVVILLSLASCSVGNPRLALIESMRQREKEFSAVSRPVAPLNLPVIPIHADKIEAYKQALKGDYEKIIGSSAVFGEYLDFVFDWSAPQRDVSKLLEQWLAEVLFAERKYVDDQKQRELRAAETRNALHAMGNALQAAGQAIQASQPPPQPIIVYPPRVETPIHCISNRVGAYIFTNCN